MNSEQYIIPDIDWKTWRPLAFTLSEFFLTPKITVMLSGFISYILNSYSAFPIITVFRFFGEKLNLLSMFLMIWLTFYLSFWMVIVKHKSIWLV